jgi:hypothetical protein
LKQGPARHPQKGVKWETEQQTRTKDIRIDESQTHVGKLRGHLDMYDDVRRADICQGR